MRSNEPAMVAEWLRQEAGVRMMAPRLTDLGYELLGARLMMGSKRPAGLLIYAAEDRQRVSLFVQDDLKDDIAPAFSREGTVGVVRWAQAGRGYGLAGPLDRDDLDALASAMRMQMRLAILIDHSQRRAA